MLALVILDCVGFVFCLNNALTYVGNNIQQDEPKVQFHAK